MSSSLGVPLNLGGARRVIGAMVIDQSVRIRSVAGRVARIAASGSLLAAVAIAQEPVRRYRVDQIIQGLDQGLSPGRWTILLSEGGCVEGGDALSATDEARLRRAKATDGLIRSIRTYACPAQKAQAPDPPIVVPPPPAPPDTAPGGPAARYGLGDAHFVRIAPGTFTMGAPDGAPDETPVRTVTLTRSIWMQASEVTNGQWKAVMGSTPTGFPGCGDECPVDNVSYDDVQRFMAQLNAATGRRYRLPTEAEWEYAARAGSTGGHAGDVMRMGWYGDNSGGKPRPARQGIPNAWGLHDMHGNVWEWVEDWYDPGYYAQGVTTDPLGPASGTHRVLRGGSWMDYADNTRSAARDGLAPSARNRSTGFRLVWVP